MDVVYIQCAVSILYIERVETVVVAIAGKFIVYMQENRRFRRIEVSIPVDMLLL